MTVEPPTTLGYSREDKIGTAVILGGGGLLVFLLAPLLAAWLADVPVVPFKGPLQWVGSFDQPWAWVVRPVIGLVVGLAVALVVITDAYRLEVDDDGLVVHHRDDRRRIDRTQVVAVYRDGKTVVIDGRDGRRLFDQEVEASRDAVADAFRRHGYPWEGV
ncbi:YqeB family protein [Mumia sp. DW29H23]|uniref:YqeB family protein n=1 Tax=Mumia sp. DW29H23 TaxID=3421241 RepID=UPI003D69D57E